jgi:hypothetical protein
MNDVAVSASDFTQALQESATLAHVQVSMWEGMRTDRRLLEKLKQDTGAVGEVGKVIKNLLTGADGLLKDTRSAYKAVQTRHYALTLAWVNDPNADRKRGPRLLPHALFDTYLQELGALKRSAIETLEDRFLPAYPDLVKQAKLNLAGMADQTYPSVDEIRSKFRIHLDFEPIPETSGYRGLPAVAIERLAKNLAARQQRQIADATQEMWAKGKERIEHLVERLSDPENMFKEASLRDVRELITLLPGWNVMGNPIVAEIAEDIKRMMSGVEAEDLRKNEKLRSSTADEAQRIADKMKKWGM